MVDPLKKTAERKDLSIKDGRILSFSAVDAKEVLDAEGCFVSCGFIDSHLHVEGLHLLPQHYNRLFLAHGTTTVITDLHEIANAGGMAGMKWYLSLLDLIPLDVFVMAPSSVPSCSFEQGAGRIGMRELRSLQRAKRVIGLGEVMDVAGVIGRKSHIVKKLSLFDRKPVDGHAPGLVGSTLDLYMSAGICSDHETTDLNEGTEKVERGMHLFIREGSVAKDMSTLLPLVHAGNMDRLSLCTDDLSAKDLFQSGHLDRLVSRLVSAHISPFDAIRLVTTNPALYFNLNDRNRLAVGKKADLAIFETPENMRVKATIKSGKVVYHEGEDTGTTDSVQPAVTGHIKISHVSKEDLRRRAEGSKIRVIGVREGTIVMEDLDMEARIDNNYLAADPERDVIFAYVFDRYSAQKKYGFGFAHGFALQKGAIGTTYAHDSHNLIVIGDNAEDIHHVVRNLEKCGGGMAASHNGTAVCVPMAHFGIISQLDGPAFLRKEAELDDLVRKMGVRLTNPFFQMSFLSLPVIPHLRLTTKGLFHVATSRYVEANHD